MARLILLNTTIKAIKSNDPRRRLSDGDGLYLRLFVNGGSHAWSPIGFFHPDRFTFGTPLERAALEAWIQAVPGVSAVEGIRIRRRGWFDWRPLRELRYRVAPGEVIRVMNDPTHPDRGSLKIKPRGGA